MRDARFGRRGMLGGTCKSRGYVKVFLQSISI